LYFATRRTALRVRKLEQRRRGDERLAELGRLTGGLAHEIKNPLSTVGLNIQLLQEDLRDLARQSPQDTPLQDGIGRIERRFGTLQRETDRLRDILEDFLRFAGRIRLDRAPANIATMVNEMADFFAPQAQAQGIHLRTQIAETSLTANIDAALIKQALLNLLINAVQAMDDARKNDQPHGGANELIIRVEKRADQIIIQVTDTGPGIPPQVADKLFEPYFSTKKGGTGLGLPTSRRIVEEHAGTLTCHSEIARGTEFTIALPIDG
jgi:signal transduction histidine kinase